MDLPQIGWKAILTLSLFILSILVAWLWGRRKEKKEENLDQKKDEAAKIVHEKDTDALNRYLEHLRDERDRMPK